jgi:hypothetical protein
VDSLTKVLLYFQAGGTNARLDGEGMAEVTEGVMEGEMEGEEIER